jgi:hypothetical protein
MKTQISLLLSFLLFTVIVDAQIPPESPPQPSQENTTEFPKASAYANSNLTYKVIDAPNSTYCYDVFADGRLMVHQTSVPGLPGNEGFKTKEDAAKVAELVIEKVRKGEMPPTVSIEEMKELKVIK